MTKPQFKISYRGEADYLFEGRTYSVRSFSHDSGDYNGDYYQTGIEPFVGCVRIGYAQDLEDYFHTFPPPHVIEAFQEDYPGIVGARYSHAGNGFIEVEYTAPRQTYWRERSRTLYAESNRKWDKAFGIED